MLAVFITVVEQGRKILWFDAHDTRLDICTKDVRTYIVQHFHASVLSLCAQSHGEKNVYF